MKQNEGEGVFQIGLLHRWERFHAHRSAEAQKASDVTRLQPLASR